MTVELQLGDEVLAQSLENVPLCLSLTTDGEEPRSSKAWVLGAIEVGSGGALPFCDPPTYTHTYNPDSDPRLREQEALGRRTSRPGWNAPLPPHPCRWKAEGACRS